MKEFWKKYWPNVVWGVILCILLFLFIPAQEKHYLEDEIEAIESKSRFAVWIVQVLFAVAMIVAASWGVKKISQVLMIIVNVSFLSLGLYFILSPLFVSGVYFLNRITSRGPVVKNYTVSFISNKTLYLYDTKEKKGFLQWDSLLIENKPGVVVGDTLAISFNKGLLGFSSDPKILDN